MGISKHQPDFYEAFHLQLPEAYQTISGVDFYRLERELADALITKCTALKAICLDLMAEIEFGLEHDFHDPIHTTASDSRVIGGYECPVKGRSMPVADMIPRAESETKPTFAS